MWYVRAIVVVYSEVDQYWRLGLKEQEEISRRLFTGAKATFYVRAILDEALPMASGATGMWVWRNTSHVSYLSRLKHGVFVQKVFFQLLIPIQSISKSKNHIDF